MARVDFYVLEHENNPQGRLKFACRLAEKAYRAGHQVYLYTNDAESAEHLDNLLWSFREDSFVPHQLFSQKGYSPVTIGHGVEKPSNGELLINLTSKVPDFFTDFERISEIVIQQSGIREAMRASYQFYKQKGHSLQTHKIQST